MNKKTLVLGASLKPYRYSNIAIKRLVENNIEVMAIGLRKGEVAGVQIETGKPDFDAIDTITLYINAQRQEEYYEYLIALEPKRILFNPGTENKVFEMLLEENKIMFEQACTLVLLSTQQY